jgi:hypothetical protein
MTTTISGDSQEAVALRLLELVAVAEKKTLTGSAVRAADAEKNWILDTYRECLEAVRKGATPNMSEALAAAAKRAGGS